MYTIEYAVLKYSPALASGESLNVGIIAFSPELRRASALVSSRLERISSAFPSVELDSIHAALKAIDRTVHAIDIDMGFDLTDGTRFPSAHSVDDVRSIVLPDNGFALFAGEPGFAMADADFEFEVKSLFESKVMRYYPDRPPRARVDRKQISRQFRTTLMHHNAKVSLFEHRFADGEGVVEVCDEVFKNGRFHVVEPVTLDYLESDRVAEKVRTAWGKASRLQSFQDFAEIVFLVAPPPDEELAERAMSEVQAMERKLAHVKYFTVDQLDEAAEYVHYAAHAADA